MITKCHCFLPIWRSHNPMHQQTSKMGIQGGVVCLSPANSSSLVGKEPQLVDRGLENVTESATPTPPTVPREGEVRLRPGEGSQFPTAASLADRQLRRTHAIFDRHRKNSVPLLLLLYMMTTAVVVLVQPWQLCGPPQGDHKRQSIVTVVSSTFCVGASIGRVGTWPPSCCRAGLLPAGGPSTNDF